MSVSNYDSSFMGWERYVSDLERADEIVGDADEPCSRCRGRGYERHDPDEPCSRCHGEGVEL